jgi:hypothetical protein
MATIIERFDSREFTEGEKPTLTLRYCVFGTEAAAEVGAVVEKTAPFQVGALFYREYTAKNVGGGVWEVEVSYDGKQRQPGTDSAGKMGGPSGPPLGGSDLGNLGGPGGGGQGDNGPGGTKETQTNDFGGKWSYEFDTSGGTQHITQSLPTTESYVEDGAPAAPDYEGAINVQEENVNGVDIVIPVFKWSENHEIPIWCVTPRYKKILFELTGSVNSEAFRGFAPQEVLFEGVSGSIKKGENWDLNYKFAASPRVINRKIGNITVNVKEGWDYLWVRYQSAVDAGALIKKPVAVYVEHVYPYKDFSLLGLGK